MGKNHEIREYVKKSWKESGLSLLKFGGMALAAITISVITSKLGSVISGLIIAGLVPIMSAVFGEFYKILLGVTALSTKKVVAPIINIPIIEEEAEEVNDTSQDIQEKEPQKKKNWFTRALAAIKGYFRKNSYMKTAISFALILAITSGISYAVSSNAIGTEIIHTTVKQQSTEQISDEEKQAIIDEAAEKASDMVPQSTTIIENDDHIDEVVSQLKLENDQLRNKIDEIEKKIATIETSSTPQSTENNKEAEQIQKLEEKIKSLEEEVALLKTEKPAPATGNEENNQ